MSKLVEIDVTSELWREYDMETDFGRRVYRIESPVKVIFREGGSTHRVVGPNGVVHLLPGPGYRNCVIRWEPRDVNKPVVA